MSDTPTPTEQAIDDAYDALHTIDRRADTNEQYGPAEARAFRQLAEAMHQLYGPLPTITKYSRRHR